MSNRKRYLVSGLAGLVLAISFLAMGSVWARRNSEDKLRGGFTKPPTVTSCVKRIEIIKTWITNPGQPDSMIAVEIRNNSDIGILAVTMNSKGPKNAYTVSLRSPFEQGTKQVVVVEPHKSAKLEMEVANAHKGQPLEIGSVMYADGSEDGCPEPLRIMRAVIADERTQKKPQ